MRHLILDGQKIRTIETFYETLAQALTLSPHFGRNLDALWDVLTTEVDGPIKITWKAAKTSKKAMPDDYAKLVDLLVAVAEERADFKVKFK